MHSRNGATRWHLHSFLPIVFPKAVQSGNIMQGFFGMSPASYNVWEGTGIPAEPLLQSLITPAVNRMLGRDDLMNRCRTSCSNSWIRSLHRQRKRAVSILFGIELKEDAFVGLREILADKMGVE